MAAKTTSEHLSTIKLYETPYWKRWLGMMLVDNPNGLGSELHEHVYDDTSRITADQGRTASDLLRAAEALGWIERTMLAPSIDQQAFDGLTYGRLSGTSKDTQAYNAQWFMFRVIDREAVRAYIGDAMPSTSTFALGDRVSWSPAFVAQIQGGAEMRRDAGTVVGFASLGGKTYPRVAWKSDPKEEPVCQAPVDEPPRCVGGGRGVRHECKCPRVPYRARATSPASIRKVA